MVTLEAQEQTVATLVKAGLENLTETEQSRLSKVLFPDTHTDKVKFAGVERTLKPLPIKYAKQLHAALLPFALRASAEGANHEQAFEADEMLLNSLTEVAKILCEFYSWGQDVLKKITDFELELCDLQGLSSVQQQLCGSNDFLLAPLRLAVKIMQVRALMDVAVNKLQASKDVSMNTQSTLTTQPSLESGTAPLTN